MLFFALLDPFITFMSQNNAEETECFQNGDPQRPQTIDTIIDFNNKQTPGPSTGLTQLENVKIQNCIQAMIL